MGILRSLKCVARQGLLCVLGMAAFVTSAYASGASKETGAQDGATLELKGLLVPLQQANLSSRAQGVIESMKEEGDQVRQGDVVVHLDDEMEKISVENAKAVLIKREYDAKSTKDLHDKGSGSLDDQRTAETNLKTAQFTLKQAEVAVERKTVHAPFDGVVTRHFRSIGEATDQYLPLLTLVDLSKVYLETWVPASRLRDVHAGQTVEVTVPDLPEKSFKGQVKLIADVIDPASGEFKMKILLSNEEHLLRSGMSAVGLLATAPHGGSVPRASAATPPPLESTRR